MKEALYILYIAKAYEVDALVLKCRELLGKNISNENVFDVWQSAESLGEDSIAEKCKKIISESTDCFVNSNVSEVSFEILTQVLKMDAVSVEEIELFKFCQKWILYHNPITEKQTEILELLRIPLISAQDLATTVSLSNWVPSDKVVEAFKFQTVPSLFQENIKKCFIKRNVLQSPQSTTSTHSRLVFGFEKGTTDPLCNELVNYPATHVLQKKRDPGYETHWNSGKSDKALLICNLTEPVFVKQIKMAIR